VVVRLPDTKRREGPEALSTEVGSATDRTPTGTDSTPGSGQVADRSPLRRALESAIAEAGSKVSMKDLTVLAPQNDPFRIDQPANHRDGAWLAVQAKELGLGERNIHLRGLHYMLIGQTKPDGKPYTNTDADWEWLSGRAGKAARWLGYLPFDQIVDQRNAAPEVLLLKRPTVWPYLTVGLDIDLPDIADIEPKIHVAGFEGVQPYKIVMVGEKSSLGEVLAPIAQRYEADLYLPTGCLSDTLIFQMAKIGAEDGRPMRVLYFADCDPAGWNMPIEVGRKLQAFQALRYPELRFEVHRVALTPDHVREYGLPSTPLKDTELRADRWRQAMGVQQTEIDSLASLRPDLLREIALKAIEPFYDATLNRRVDQARREWITAAQRVIDGTVDQGRLDRLRAEAESRLAELVEQIETINDQMRLDVGDFDLPPVEVPQSDLGDAMQPKPLVDSEWSFGDQCRALIDSKAYRAGGDT